MDFPYLAEEDYGAQYNRMFSFRFRAGCLASLRQRISTLSPNVYLFTVRTFATTKTLGCLSKFIQLVNESLEALKNPKFCEGIFYV